jgi:hypothetical protein
MARMARIFSATNEVYFADLLPRFSCYVLLMQVTLDIPEPLAKKFLSAIPARRRSSTVTRLLREELRRRELTAACHAANRDAALNRDIADWQSFDEPVLESIEPRHRFAGATSGG